MRNPGTNYRYPQRYAAAGILLLLSLFLLAACRAPQAADAQAQSPSLAEGEDGASELSTGSNIASDSGGRADSPLIKSENEAGDESMPLRDSYYACAAKTEGVTQAIQDCIEEEYGYQDSRLNHVYRKLMEELPGAQQKPLREAQRSWVAKRDRKCNWDAETEGDAQRLEANECLLTMTAMRADELEAMTVDRNE